MSKIYHSLVTNLAFPLIDIFGGTKFYKSYKLLKKLEFSNRENIINFQTKKLRELLQYSYENVPYYKKQFSSLGLVNFDDFQISDLLKIPALNRDIIRENFDLLKSKEFDRIIKKYHSTGGSTGNPMSFYQDYDSYSFSWPANIRGWGMIGFTLGDPFMTMGSSSLIKKKKNFGQKILHVLFKDHTYGGINFSDEIFEKYLSEIKKNKIKYIYGYASSIYLLAQYVIKKGYQVKLDGVMPTSEICPDYYKEAYIHAFNCKVCDSYGARDGNIAAFQCEHGNFHLSEYSVQIIEGGKTTGKVLTTDLFNKSMPLINYDVGDILTISDEQCKCGRNQMIAKEILGRVQSVITLDNGRSLTGPGWTILFKDRNVKKYRLRQIDGKSIEADIVKGRNYNEKIEEPIIFNDFYKHAGKDTSLKINYVDDIDNSNSGKATYFIAKEKDA